MPYVCCQIPISDAPSGPILHHSADACSPRPCLSVRDTMPRLGDDPNVATAYPDRVSTNLRGSWVRQMFITIVMTVVLYKVVCTDYKVR